MSSRALGDSRPQDDDVRAHLMFTRPHKNNKEDSMLSIAIYNTSSLQDRLLQPSDHAAEKHLEKLKQDVELLVAAISKKDGE